MMTHKNDHTCTCISCYSMHAVYMYSAFYPTALSVVPCPLGT